MLEVQRKMRLTRAGQPSDYRKVRIMAEVAVQKKEKETVWDELQKMEDRIMKRAYDIFCGSGFVPGKDLDDWLAAERELVWKPAIELTEKDNQFEIRIAVAGIDPKDLNVEVTSDDLLVKGETKTEKKVDKGEVHTSELQSGSLFRSIHFPKNVDPEKVKAEIKNGLLTVVAPIAEEARTRKVNVQAA
jgi:HSP20 family protein